MVFLAGEDANAKRVNEELGVLARKSVDQTVTSSTTLVNDTALTWSLADANTRYAFDLYLAYTGATAGNLLVGWGVPAGAAMAWFATGLDTALAYKNLANLSAGTTTSFGAAGVSLGRVAQVSGTILLDSTTGSFTLRWAQNTSNASATTMRAGSFGVVYRV